LQQRFHELGDVAVRFLDGLRQSQGGRENRRSEAEPQLPLGRLCK
jgi:hypothetical protein